MDVDVDRFYGIINNDKKDLLLQKTLHSLLSKRERESRSMHRRERKGVFKATALSSLLLSCLQHVT